jgi:hypothetical protein
MAHSMPTPAARIQRKFHQAVHSAAAFPWWTTTPFNQLDLNRRDVDTGSSGTLPLPDSAGSPAHPHLLTSAGKEGRIYPLDRENPGLCRQRQPDRAPLPGPDRMFSTQPSSTARSISAEAII